MADRVDFETRQELAKGMLSAAQRHTKLNGDGTATLPASNLSAVFNELVLALQREETLALPAEPPRCEFIFVNRRCVLPDGHSDDGPGKCDHVLEGDNQRSGASATPVLSEETVALERCDAVIEEWLNYNFPAHEISSMRKAVCELLEKLILARAATPAPSGLQEPDWRGGKGNERVHL